MEDTEADIVTLQETKLTEKDTAPTDWTLYRRDRTIHRSLARGQAQGGIATLVRPGINTKPINKLNLPATAALENIGVSVQTRDGWLDVWNIYRPPARGGQDTRDATLHTSAWPHSRNTVICSDINAHGQWDLRHDTDETGSILQEWMDDTSMTTLNSGLPTRFDSRGNGTAPDVTVVSAQSAHLFEWQTDSIGSDHVPIVITTTNKTEDEPQQKRLNIRKADWEAYQTEIVKELAAHPLECESIEKEHNKLVEAITKASKKAMPTTTRKNPKPWWSEECELAKRTCNKAEKEARKNRGNQWFQDRYNEAQKKLKDTVVESKRASWRSFAGTLEARTPTTKVWNTLRAMDGRRKSRLPNQPIRQDSKTFITDRSKAEGAVRVYAQVSKVHIPRTDEKDAYMAYRGGLKTEDEDMDKPFTRLDLNTVLGKTKASAPGLDGLHPLMLINLPEEGKDRLLHLINRSWTEGRVPSSWKLACIIPILKKDKPVDEIKSFRPVSLLPSIFKAMESLVQIRLKNWTEDHNIIPAEQAGFQPFRSTSDVFASICQDAMDGLQRKKRTLLVAVDFKAAFDRVWRGGLLRDLAKHGLSGRCLRWLHSWIADRRSLVKWNNRTSRAKVFSQGSPLSPLLYCIATADLPRRIKAAAPTAAPRQFADDLTIGAAADTPGEAATDTQIALNVITEWAEEHQVMISVEKTEAVVVSLDPRETAGKAQPPITLLEMKIDYKKEVTISSATTPRKPARSSASETRYFRRWQAETGG